MPSRDNYSGRVTVFELGCRCGGVLSGAVLEFQISGLQFTQTRANMLSVAKVNNITCNASCYGQFVTKETNQVQLRTLPAHKNIRRNSKHNEPVYTQLNEWLR